MRRGTGWGGAPGAMRVAAVVWVTAGSSLAAGCVAPLLVAGASGAGMFGAHKSMSAIQRHQMASDDRLRSISAANVGGSAEDITISDKHWRHGVLHWVAVNRNGQRFGCEMGEANWSCAPLAS
jgi:hypothetical protein